MSSRKRKQALPTVAVNALLREIQQGHLPDVERFSQTYRLPPSTSVESLVTCSNRHGDTPFLVAARYGQVDLLKRLHDDYGIPVHHSNDDGKNALHEAAQHGQVDSAHFLIGAGLNVDCLKRADWTPLMLACTKNCKKMVEILVEYGASLSLRNKDGWTPFHIACREGHPEIVRFLLDTDGSCWETVSKNGRTPLHSSALHGKLETLEVLHTRCKYDPNIKDSCGVTPLMDAARGDHVALLEFLLHRCGASLSAVDELGREATHHAAQSGAINALECLLKNGADVNKKASINSITPLHYAAKEGQAEAISILLKNGADPSITDTKGRTALDIARNARDSKAAVAVLENFTQL